MRTENFPEHIRQYLIPQPRGHVVYQCLGCEAEYDISRLLYTCPECRSVLLLTDLSFDRGTLRIYKGKGKKDRITVLSGKAADLITL